ncbi:multidrug effflux MFS transporter [Luteithermobacter gelatinilyticus]|uniref:multidrug effflux MFS transporter n=1 Tax=Luteithermobacter gelatinilyticus TaxID=2582913 RepID=UPI001105B36A|nr:multidrug effflux MFS transporter [Luteithermobacter gelatinilyticus]
MAFAKPVWVPGQEKKIGFVLFLATLSGLSPFAMAIVVPSLPGLAHIFQLEYDSLQYAVSAYLLGIGLSQPVHGFLCDRYGRRPVLLFSLLLFVLASLGCVIVENWFLLVTMRFMQAIGVGVGTVTSRAIVTDVSSRQHAAQTLSYIAMAMGIGPIIAPVLGGYLDVTFGWQSSFLFSGVVGAVVLLFAWARLAETRPDAVRVTGGSFGQVLRQYLGLLRSPVFMGYTLVFGFCQGTFFAFLPVAPQVFETRFRIGAELFGVYWGILSFSYMLGAFFSGRLMRTFDLDATLFAGCSGLFVSTLILFLAALYGSVTFMVLLSTITVGMFFSGIASPLALTGSVSHNPEMAGAASGLSSSLGMGVGALFSILTGHLFDGTEGPMIRLMGMAVTGVMMALFMSRNRGAKAG